MNSASSLSRSHGTLVLFSSGECFAKLNPRSHELLLQEIRRNPLLWLLVFAPISLGADKLNREAPTLHFVLSVLAILARLFLLSHATESVLPRQAIMVYLMFATALYRFAACRKQVNQSPRSTV